MVGKNGLVGKTKRKERLLCWGSQNYRLFIKLIGRKILIGLYPSASPYTTLITLLLVI